MEYKNEITNEDLRIETENRIKNLMWTVSGDYSLNAMPDVESFQRSKYISLYDAIKQGAFARYFNKEELALYLVKKLFFSANEVALTNVAQLCVDFAVHLKIAKERPGVPFIRRRAFADILEMDFAKMSASYFGQVKFALLREAIDGEYGTTNKIMVAASKVKSLEPAAETMDIIRVTDELYNLCVDQDFEKRFGGLDQVMAVSMEELREYGWQDFLDEDTSENLEQYMEKMSNAVTNSADAQAEEKTLSRYGANVIYVSEEDQKKMDRYVSLNYGKTYLSEQEEKRLNHSLCRGMHTDCRLYFTDGILKDPIVKNYQFFYNKQAKEKNEAVYAQNLFLTKRNVEVLTDTLKRALTIRNERDFISSEYGKILPKLLWKVGRTSETKLFCREIKKDNSEFAVDVLIDSSGSQRNRQSLVALQGFMISEALSIVGIPHRVLGFCTFWDYTVMHRFRDYADPRSSNRKIFEFHPSSNNRDGLALRAAAEGLMQRPEENKVMIVLSDGRPNDRIANRSNSRKPESYSGEPAIKDTALEVRRIRGNGISVLGVFAGDEMDLTAERRIFGKDFAYIRNIKNFSQVVGRYLRKQLDEME